MLTAYSLGTSCPPGKSLKTAGLVLKLEFTKKGDQTELTGYHYDPTIWREMEEPGVGAFEILNIRDEISLYESQYVGRVSQEVYEALKQSLEQVEVSVKPGKKNLE